MEKKRPTFIFKLIGRIVQIVIVGVVLCFVIYIGIFAFFYIRAMFIEEPPLIRSTIYDTIALNRIHKIAIATFVANEALTIGKFSYDYETRYTRRPDLIQTMSKIFAISLHDTLLDDADFGAAGISFISAKKVIESEYYRSLKNKYLLEYDPDEFLASDQRLINALPDFLVYVPPKETIVFANLIRELGTDAILWIKCDYYLDVALGSDATGGIPLWESTMAIETKLYGSGGKLIWEAHNLGHSSWENGVSKGFLKSLINKNEAITGETMIYLLQNATEASVDSVTNSLKRTFGISSIK